MKLLKKWLLLLLYCTSFIFISAISPLITQKQQKDRENEQEKLRIINDILIANLPGASSNGAKSNTMSKSNTFQAKGARNYTKHSYAGFIGTPCPDICVYDTVLTIVKGQYHIIICTVMSHNNEP